MPNRPSLYASTLQNKKTLTFLSITFLLLSVFFLNLQTCSAQSSTIFSDDFETGNFSLWTGTEQSQTQLTNMSVETTNPHSGSHDAYFESANRGSYADTYKFLPSALTIIKADFFIRLLDYPSQANTGQILYAGLERQDGSQAINLIAKNIGGNIYWGIAYWEGAGSHSLHALQGWQ
jgi:hypothetical protein